MTSNRRQARPRSFKFSFLLVRDRSNSSANRPLSEEKQPMRSKNTLAVFAALLLLIGSTSFLKAQREWIHLGDKHVDGNSDHDKISLVSAEGWLRQLQIRVEEAPVSFKRVVVHFGNGTEE